MPENVTVDPSVKLSNGNVVVLRETTGFDEESVEDMLTKKGVKPEGFGFMKYIRALAMFSIETVNGQPPTPLTDYASVQAMVMGFSSKDLNAILEKYGELNGRSNGKDTEGN